MVDRDRLDWSYCEKIVLDISVIMKHILNSFRRENKRGRTMKNIMLFAVSICLLFLTGCSQNNAATVAAEVKPVQAFYTSTINNIDRLEMLRSDGTRKNSTNSAAIAAWLEQIGKMEVTTDPYPEDSSGVLFSITCYENNEIVLRLSPRAINNTTILVNDELVDAMHALWDSGDLMEMR